MPQNSEERLRAVETRLGKLEGIVESLVASLGSVSQSEMAPAVPDSAANPGAGYVQAESQAILNELRALKVSLRSENIIQT